MAALSRISTHSPSAEGAHLLPPSHVESEQPTIAISPASIPVQSHPLSVREGSGENPQEIEGEESTCYSFKLLSTKGSIAHFTFLHRVTEENPATWQQVEGIYLEVHSCSNCKEVHKFNQEGEKNFCELAFIFQGLQVEVECLVATKREALAFARFPGYIAPLHLQLMSLPAMIIDSSKRLLDNMYKMQTLEDIDRIVRKEFTEEERILPWANEALKQEAFLLTELADGILDNLIKEICLEKDSRGKPLYISKKTRKEAIAASIFNKLILELCVEMDGMEKRKTRHAPPG